MKQIKKKILQLISRWEERASGWDACLKDPKHYSNFEHSYERTDYFTEKLLKTYKGNNKAKNAIDLGCGTGESTKKLRQYAASVYGIDIAGSMIRIAKRKYPDIHFSVQNVWETRFANKKFDIIISRGVLLSHIPSGTQSRMLDEISRISRPGSLIVLDFLHDIVTKKKFTKYSDRKTAYDREGIIRLFMRANIAGKFVYSGRKEERVNRVAVIRA